MRKPTIAAMLLLASPLIASAGIPEGPELPLRRALPSSGLLAAGETRSGEQIDAPGRRSLWLGTESGELEGWVYPLKVLRGLRLRFAVGTSWIDGASIARKVEVRPEWTTISYVHEAFTVRQLVAAPIDQPALLMLLEVDASVPMTVGVDFHIDLHPMWPASLGGQFSSWDPVLPGFVLGDGSRAAAGVVISPTATEPSVQPAHSLPDQPTSFRLHIEPRQAAAHWYPIVVGAWTRGMTEPADSAALRDLALDLAGDPLPALERLVEHYRGLSRSGVRIRTPEPRLDEALAWAAVRLDQGLVCNPHLGCGLVAGYGGSGAGYRPGFAWFFGGDAFYNSWALTALGAHDTVRQALQMLADNQRADGKIMHELSQGAGTLRWFEDYPYGFYHAETTPYFIDAVVRHATATGDLQWARGMWPHVLLALQYCLQADSDGDGLMDNSAAGLAAVEMGALRQLGVHQDIYLASVWARAVAALPALATALGEHDTAEQAAALAARARVAIDGRMGADGGGWAFAIAGDGSQVREPTVWNVLPAALGVGTTMRAGAALAEVASPEITTDWGTRMLSSASPLYDPLIYNQGTVWPFLTGFAAMAAYSHGNVPYGKDLIDGLVDLSERHSRGAIHEVLSGDRLAAMGPSVPHQLFSTSSLVTPTIAGLFGIEMDRLQESLTVAPSLPPSWPRAEVHGLRWRDAMLDLALGQDDGSIELRATLDADVPPPRLQFAPRLPAAAHVLEGTTAQAVGCAQQIEPAAVEWQRQGSGWAARAGVRWAGGLPLEFRGPRAATGDRSLGLRVRGCEPGPDGGLVVMLAGRSDTAYELQTAADVEVQATDMLAERLQPGSWRLRFERADGPGSAYVDGRLTLRREVKR